jgi:hypothetical protein
LQAAKSLQTLVTFANTLQKFKQILIDNEPFDQRVVNHANKEKIAFVCFDLCLDARNPVRIARPNGLDMIVFPGTLSIFPLV